MKRRIHGPNSTPLVSNWIAGPEGAVVAAVRVVERRLLGVARQVPQRLAERTRCSGGPPAGAVSREAAGDSPAPAAGTRQRYWRPERSRPRSAPDSGVGGCGGPGCLACCCGCGGGDFSTYSGVLPLANGCVFFGCGACSGTAPADRGPTCGARSGGLLGVSSTRGCMNTNAGLIALLLLEHRQTLGLGCLGGLQPLEIRQLRQQDENQDDDEQVDDDRQQHAFARGECAWHPLDIRVSVLEIEVHQ